MNIVKHTLFHVLGEKNVCVIPYKVSNRQNKCIFGVFDLFYWLLLGMNKVRHALFQVIVETQECVMPYKSSDRQSKNLFGVFYLINWFLVGKNRVTHKMFQVLGKKHAYVMLYKTSNRQSKYLFGVFFYFIDYFWVWKKSTPYYFRSLVTHSIVLWHINHPIDSTSSHLENVFIFSLFWGKHKVIHTLF